MFQYDIHLPPPSTVEVQRNVIWNTIFSSWPYTSSKWHNPVNSYHTWKRFSSFHIRTIFMFMCNIIEGLKAETCLLLLKTLNWKLSCILLCAIWMLKWADSRCLLPEILIFFFWHLACLLKWVSFWGTALITSSKIFFFSAQ